MEKAQVVQKIKELGIVPVIRADSPEEALRAAAAIREGGISVLEITMTVPGAIRAIETLAGRFADQVILGAGTVLDEGTASSCIAAGAQFIVSPAISKTTIEFCRQHAIAVMPGTLTPTEVVRAWSLGADLVKVFPASAVGGASYIKALKAALPDVDLVPTGGVSVQTAADFIRAGAVALGVGSDLVDNESLRAGKDSILTERARRFVRIVQEARGTKGAPASHVSGN